MRCTGTLAMSAALILAAAGCGSAAGSDGSGPIKIGLSTPLSGSAASLGENERRGVELAIDQVNDEGGVLGGRRLSLAAEDNACNPTDGASSLTKLITKQRVSTVIGALCSGVTLSAMPLAKRHRVPFIVSTSTSPDITTASGKGGNEFTFRINPSDATLAGALATHLASAGKIRKLAILAEDSTYGRTGAKAFDAALRQKGLGVTGIDYVAQGTADFSTQISKYRNNGTEGVALYVSGADHLGFLRQAAGAGLRLPMTGRVEFEGQNLEILKKEQFAGSSSVYPYSSLIDTPENAKFTKLYQSRHKTAPTYESFEGYNAVMVIADAVRRARSSDPVDIQKALVTTDMTSLTGGTVKFDDHNQAHDKAFILQLKRGEVFIESDVTT
ncbi:ABC transporter substrate-binding protein [Actinomadura madurae]|uniref:ABC transporter substrate-binding protein n=2 Tax=Actinomadura madurae TaxID=1993 RepID=UPI0020262BA1|nr:ABC transporter substrate-binding protein [Actinomadura madurae]MCP9955299.1 ABC transporter substrate-binding protein [Actinomadura madurae]URN02913.1 ABC transporter substrate-binding protein [Actinomadura madurae]